MWPRAGYDSPASHHLTGPAARLADLVLFVQADHGLSGPHLDEVDRNGGIGDEVEWKDLARVLGQPAPYWPLRLRTADVIGTWKPGDAPVTALAEAEPDTAPLYRVAATVDSDSPAYRTLTNLAQSAQWLATNSTRFELDLLNDYDPATFVIAAQPQAVPETDVDDLDASVRRAGWLDILARTGPDAEACVRAALMYSSGADLPYGNPVDIDPEDPVAREWVARLVPTDRSAAFMVLDPDRNGEPLIDPVTDAPAVRFPNRYPRPELTAAAPQRLPTTSPLVTVQLAHHRVWIRTDDGTLWLAPSDATYGLTWGYNGTGPRILAKLLASLLDDITAPGATLGDGAPPPGLADLTRQKWPDGITLTRAQLVSARDSNPDTPD